MSETQSEAPWPNRQPVVDGVAEVSQDPDLFADDPDDDPADELKGEEAADGDG